MKTIMLNAAQHEIINANKFKNIKEFTFLGLDKPRMLFSLLIMSYLGELIRNVFITLGPGPLFTKLLRFKIFLSLRFELTKI